jgi:hypothetical protein
MDRRLTTQQALTRFSRCDFPDEFSAALSELDPNITMKRLVKKLIGQPTARDYTARLGRVCPEMIS